MTSSSNPLYSIPFVSHVVVLLFPTIGIPHPLRHITDNDQNSFHPSIAIPIPFQNVSKKNRQK